MLTHLLHCPFIQQGDLPQCTLRYLQRLFQMCFNLDDKITCEVGSLTAVEVTVIGREPKHLNSFLCWRGIQDLGFCVCAAVDISRRQKGLRLRKTLPDL